MYLKSIEMQGFKSFPDRTRLVFDPIQGGTAGPEGGRGVTVIVGPNGSGKSNIADAMRWVLGEVSSKSLRGNKLEDVIFGGADSRRPMGYAEVSVTFDNRSAFCHLDCPYDEVTVTRRYFRSGDSDYLINKKPVRLRDIYDLFLNTGIGRDGYSIIGQGRIAEIISRKSEERRGIFEDAAGIARYRVRKTESERKLKDTEANMVRIRDVFAEVEAQVGPLEREASKAKRGLILLENRKQADVSLWLYDTERLRGEIQNAQTARTHADFDLSQAQDAVESLEVQNKRLTEMNQGSREASGRLTQEITLLNEEQHRLDSEYRVRESHITHAEETVESLRASRALKETERQGALTEADTHRKKAAELRAALSEMESRYAKGETQASDLRKHVDQLDGEIAVAGEDIRCREAEAVDLRVRLSVLENARSTGSDRGSGLVSDMERYEETARTLMAEQSKRQRAVDGYKTSLDENTAELDLADRTLTERNTAYGEKYETLSSLKLQRDSVAQRIHTYRSMEEHFEGYANSVRYVMSQYAAGRITTVDGGACGTIYGPLSQVISVNQLYVVAVETALGANLQHMVVEDETTAKAAMYALKRGDAGRATFFPLTSMRGQVPTDDMKRAVGFEGYIAVADTLVSCEDRFRAVVSSLLGRTVVFDTIDHATAMAKALRYRVRVVTLDGQQINVGGSFTGGSLSQKNGALSRAAEIRRLDEELAASRSRVVSAEEELGRLRDSIGEAEEAKNTLEDKRDLLRVLLSNETAQLDQVKAQREANDTLLSRMREDCQKILRESERYEEDMASLKAEEVALTRAIEEIRAVREQKAAESADAEEHLNTLTAAQTQLYIAVSETRKDAETEEAFAAAAETRAGEAAGEIQESERKETDLIQAVRVYRTEQADNRRVYQEGEEKLRRLGESRAETDQNSAGYEARLASLREQINRKYEEKENLFKVFTTADNRLQNLIAEKDKLDIRLMEDYEMTREDALALNYPPVTPENRAEVAATQIDCRNKLRALGHFDPEAVDKYNETRTRYETMKIQIDDLEASRAELTGVISRLEEEMKAAFVTAFDAINQNFCNTFAELFGGGSAEVTLTDPDHVLESGIEIKAAPPGKIIKSLMQLSGGEQAFVGVALFFAILKVNPTPFCILDEIEAALDEVNVERLAQYIRRYTDDTQFIMITHRRGTMAAATRLYGVTMPEHGISKVLTLDVADIAKSKEKDWNGLFK